MPLTPEDVQAKRFTVTRFKAGYDEDEVDAFLDEVEAELRRLLGENADLRGQAGGAPAAPPPPQPTPTAAVPPAAAPPPTAEQPEGQEAALRTLLLAQRTADEAVTQARTEASQIVAQAQSQAAAFEREARERQAAELGTMARQRQELERNIEALRGFEREYRTRLRAYLESQLHDLESRVIEPGGGAATSGGSAPAGSPAPVPPTAVRPSAGPPSAVPPSAVPPTAGPTLAPPPRPAGSPFTSAPPPGAAPTAPPPGVALAAPPVVAPGGSGPFTPAAPPVTPTWEGHLSETDTTDVDERRESPPGG